MFVLRKITGSGVEINIEMGDGYTLITKECNPKEFEDMKGPNEDDWDLRKCFEQLRFDKNHHLGLGDIRLTIAQQEEICELVERFYRCR